MMDLVEKKAERQTRRVKANEAETDTPLRACMHAGITKCKVLGPPKTAAPRACMV
jgi:hypothetical protein